MTLVTTTGIATASAAPEKVHIQVLLEATERVREAAKEKVAVGLEHLLNQLSFMEGVDFQATLLSEWNYLQEKVQVFKAFSSVDVVLEDLSRLPELREAIASSGETVTIGAVHFKIKDPVKLLRQARLNAVAMAQAAAVDYAQAVEMTLGELQTIVDHGPSENGGRLVFPQKNSAEGRRGSSVHPPDALLAESRVEMTFELLPRG